ncbi:hypothetical protein Fluta_1287 [Fluviicola taffensis DSM 16823]|uniref:Uncharacterized protein n=2 Tax=Fluviicola TaxID=332102 RepID=F2IC56_FLUTR|nr:hypothetical protein Fluta_1287 [Fluviicola taffensis DSM 16823]
MPNKYTRFLPFEKYRVVTTLSEEEIIERLKIITRTISKIQFSTRKAAILRSNYDYNGEISGKNFEIWRNINYRNSFIPIITGTVGSKLDKTEIHVSMKLSLLAKIVLIIVLSIACVIFLIGFTFYPFGFKVFIPVFAIILSYLVIFLAFKLEARISKKDLNTIFKAETETNTL